MFLFIFSFLWGLFIQCTFIEFPCAWTVLGIQRYISSLLEKLIMLWTHGLITAYKKCCAHNGPSIYVWWIDEPCCSSTRYSMNEWTKQLNKEPLVQLFQVYPSYMNLVLLTLRCKTGLREEVVFRGIKTESLLSFQGNFKAVFTPSLKAGD